MAKRKTEPVPEARSLSPAVLAQQWVRQARALRQAQAGVVQAATKSDRAAAEGVCKEAVTAEQSAWESLSAARVTYLAPTEAAPDVKTLPDALPKAEDPADAPADAD